MIRFPQVHFCSSNNHVEKTTAAWQYLSDM
jgi:hypothetical protein